MYILIFVQAAVGWQIGNMCKKLAMTLRTLLRERESANVKGLDSGSGCRCGRRAASGRWSRRPRSIDTACRQLAGVCDASTSNYCCVALTINHAAGRRREVSAANRCNKQQYIPRK